MSSTQKVNLAAETRRNIREWEQQVVILQQRIDAGNDFLKTLAPQESTSKNERSSTKEKEHLITRLLTEFFTANGNQPASTKELADFIMGKQSLPAPKARNFVVFAQRRETIVRVEGRYGYYYMPDLVLEKST